MLVLAFVLLAIGAVAAACALELPWTGTLVATYLIAFGEIVLVTEILSIFEGLRPRNVLLAEVVIAIGAVAWWFYRAAPRPTLPRIRVKELRRHPAIVVLGSAVAVALVLELALAVVAVPNNWDSMTYHLSRAAAWYQHNAYGHVNAHTERQNAFPPNAEILSLFTMIFAGNERFAALPQFASELALLVAIFGIARRLGFRRSEAAFASLLFATLSQVVLQATTTQNDLVLTACVVAGAYFLLARDRHEIVLAALALALALGTKLTGFFAAPIVLLLALATLPRRQLALFAAALVVGFAVVASPVYAMNIRDYGDPLGPSSLRRPFEAKLGVGPVAATFGRIFYGFVDLSGVRDGGIPPPKELDAFAYVPRHVHAVPPTRASSSSSFRLNARANEDVSYFGPLGALLLLPLAFRYIALAVRSRVPRSAGVLAMGLPLYALEVSLAYSYNEWIGRFMIVPVGLAAPFVARGYAMRELRALLVTLGVLFLTLALVHNERKPVGLGRVSPIWSYPRPEAQAVSRPEMATALTAVDLEVPANATVGYVLGEDGWDYPLYGEHLERTLIRLSSREPLQDAGRRGVQWVVIGNVDARGSAKWFALRFKGSEWSLMAPSSSRSASMLKGLVRSSRKPLG